MSLVESLTEAVVERLSVVVVVAAIAAVVETRVIYSSVVVESVKVGKVELYMPLLVESTIAVVLIVMLLVASVVVAESADMVVYASVIVNVVAAMVG